MDVSVESERIRSLVASNDLAELARLVRSMAPRDVVEAIHSLPVRDAAIAFRLLEKDESIQVFEELDSDDQAELLGSLGEAEIGEVFAALDPEEQAWLLDEVPAKVAKRLVASVGPSELETVMGLLGYPQASVGRRMSPQVLRSTPDEDVASLLERLRATDAAPELLARVPVLSADRELLGEVDPIVLLRHAPGTTVGEVMDPEPAFAFATDDAEQAARHALDDGDLLVPVVDSEHRLVGVLPIGDAARIDRKAVAEDHARAGASEPLRRPYLLNPVHAVTRARIVWLLVLAVSAVLTVQVLEVFEDALAERVTLALFVPLLIGIGGNTGSQAATTVTRALALGEVRVRDVGRVAFKEVRTGFLLGSVLAVLAFAATSLFYDTQLGVVIAVTLLLNCPIAATVGGVVPLVARACRVDPAVFSTPFISTFCDATGLLVYFSVAVTVLGL